MPAPLTLVTLGVAPVAALGLLLTTGPAPPARAAHSARPAHSASSAPVPGPTPPPPWRAPLGHWQLLRSFRAPTTTWAAGHRGVDLAAEPGEPVFAVADGRVAFAGTVAGRGVVAVDHGRIRSTYEPVTPTLPVGTAVHAGEVIGVVASGGAPSGAAPGGAHCRQTCLHLGARVDGTDDYQDPLSLLRGQVRLLPPTNPPWPP